MSWAVFWGASLALALVAFAGLAVWVTVAGFRDIKRLFRHLDSVHGAADLPDEEP